ncbi:MAG: glycine zipper 2TM domain-containing protein [Betaproteobacteria bacterium]
MKLRSLAGAFLMAVAGFLPASGAIAQTGVAVIHSFSVDQVAQLTPGTELIFRATGTAGGQLVLDIDGMTNQLGLAETSAGNYAGAYTVSIRDKIPFDAQVKATLRVGSQQVSALLGQHLLTNAEYARMLAAAAPAAPQISRIETRNTGAYSGGHELSFIVDGTPGAAAQVSLDGGQSSIALVEQRSGHYTGRYTVKTRDQFSATTPAVVTLAFADKTVRAAKDLAPGATAQTTQAAVAAPACDACGVVVSVKKVKVKGQSNYIGAIAGGVGGAALGNQVGKGNGKAAATILGAVGGAFAGREIEKQVKSDTRYDVVVRLDNGSSRTLSYDHDPGLTSGAKVQVVGDVLQLRQ